MINIKWTLDEEEGIDPIDPLGDITLTDGRTSFSVESTYLDSWFSALITGINAVKSGHMATVEVAEEPDILIFEPWESGMILFYQNSSLRVNKIEEFMEIFRHAVQKFLCQVDNCERNPLLNLIRDFLEAEKIPAASRPHPPPTIVTISRRSPSWISVCSQNWRWIISPLYSTATNRGFNPNCSNKVGKMVWGGQVQDSPFTCSVI